MTNIKDMKVGIPYRVTKGSVNEEFQAGDVIYKEKNGDILNPKAAGWMLAEYLAEATQGWEFEVAQDLVDLRRATLLKEIKSLEDV